MPIGSDDYMLYVGASCHRVIRKQENSRKRLRESFGGLHYRVKGLIRSVLPIVLRAEMR
jgi:hypothetical protein